MPVDPCCCPDAAGGLVEQWDGIDIPNFPSMTQHEAELWKGHSDDDPDGKYLVRDRMFWTFRKRGGSSASLRELLSDNAAKADESTVLTTKPVWQRDYIGELRQAEDAAKAAAEAKQKSAEKRLKAKERRRLAQRTPAEKDADLEEEAAEMHRRMQRQRQNRQMVLVHLPVPAGEANLNPAVLVVPC